MKHALHTTWTLVESAFHLFSRHLLYEGHSDHVK